MEAGRDDSQIFPSGSLSSFSTTKCFSVFTSLQLSLPWLVFPPVKLIVSEFHPQLSVFQQTKCWIKQRTAWLVTCQSGWTKFGNIWMVGVDFPPCLQKQASKYRNRTKWKRINNLLGCFYTSHSRYHCKIWLITCISAGKKLDERITCTNMRMRQKASPRVS